MLNLLDQVIRTVLDLAWSAPPAKPDFYFAVPDEGWRQRVKQGIRDRLDIYLYEVRENRDLRRAPWDVIELADGTAVSSQPPSYVDVHYLISSWSRIADDNEAVSPIPDEHALLAEALRILFRTPEVIPADIGVVGGGVVFQAAPIYLTVAPPEMPRVLNDFWSTMKLPWRPAIQLIATAPVDLLRDTAPMPLMTTFIQRYVPLNGALDEVIQIGGWVLRDADGTPIAGATVRLTASGEQIVTGADGRYTFLGLRRGVHRIRAEAAGFAPLERDVDVPDGLPEDHIFRLS